MGECGCGNFNSELNYKVGKNVLAIEVYDGCENCETPIGVLLHFFTPQSAKRWGIHHEKLAECKPGEDGWTEVSVPVLDPRDLIEAAKSDEFLEICGEIDLSEYASLAEILEEHGLTLLQIAMQGRFSRYAERYQKNKDGLG